MKPIRNKPEADHLLEVCNRLIREGKPTKALESLGVIESFYQQHGCTEETAWCNFRQAQAEVVLGHTQAGLEKYVGAQHGFLEVDLPVEAATCMENQANILDGAGRHTDAERLYMQAGIILQEKGAAEAFASCVMNLGICKFHLGDIEGALSCFDLAKDVYRQLGQLDRVGSCEKKKLAIQALASDSTNKYGEAKVVLEANEQAGQLQTQAKESFKKGDIESARRDLERASKILEDAGLDNTPIWGEILISLVEVTARSGNIGQALSDLQSLIRLPAFKQSYSFQARGHIVAGTLLDELGQPYQAIVCFEKAVELLESRKEIQERLMLASAYHNWGIVLAKCRRLEEATNKFQVARTIFVELEDSHGAAAVDLSLVNIEIDSEQITSQQAREKLAMKIFTLESMDEKRYALVGKLNLVARTASAGDLTEAKTLVNSCISELKELGDPQVLIEGYALLSSVLENIPDCEEQALHLLLESITNIRLYRDSLRSDQERILFLADKAMADVYTKTISLCWKLEQVKKAFQLHEESRNYALLARFAERTADLEIGIPEELKERIDKLHDEFSQLMKQLGGSEASEESLLHDLSDLSKQIERVEAEARSLNPRYEILSPVSAIDLCDFQTRMDSQTLLLKYAVMPEQILVWAVSHDSFSTTMIEDPRSSSDMIQEYVNLLKQPLLFYRNQSPYTPYPEKVSRRCHLAHEIYLQLVEPALSKLSARRPRRLLVCPDGFINHLPFESLIVSPSLSWQDRPNYLLDDMAVNYSPSATVYSSLTSLHSSASNQMFMWVAFGNPLYGRIDVSAYHKEGFQRTEGFQIEIDDLPFTKEEVLRIAQVLELPAEGGHINLGPDANSIRVKRVGLDRYRTIHFACHCYLPDDVTWLNEPALLLSFVGGKGEAINPFLRYSDVVRLNLDADLIVLSACNTGFGPNFRGEGLIGLARAFIYAGARSVVASLWTVSDASTPHLMEAFYRQMTDGLDIDEALRLAKLALMKRVEPIDELADMGLQAYYLDPFFWAPFVIVGSRKVPPLILRKEKSDERTSRCSAM